MLKTDFSLLKLTTWAGLLLFSVHVHTSFAETSPSTDSKIIRIGTLTGIQEKHPTFEIIQEAYRRIGWSTELVTLPYERSEYEANRGRIIDAELARTSEAEKTLTNLIRIEPAIFPVYTSIFTLRDDLTVTDWDSLRGLRIDTVRGMHTVAERLGDIPFNEVGSIEQTIQRLQTGRTDVAILPGYETELLLEELGIAAIHRLTPDLETFLLYHYLHEQHADIVQPLQYALWQVIHERQVQQAGTQDNHEQPEQQF